jgi:hypothetical protein
MYHASSRRSVRVFAVVLPMSMALAVVATANHFVLDVVVGAALAMLGFAVAHRLAALGERHPALAPFTPGVRATVPTDDPAAPDRR